ncbi:MAG: hypothetical protein LBM75_04135 [Myxococcales bacterium]|jgi:hypothetical protein|nr:hypothetical protein [Myxococcales bacterium]
MNDVLSEKLGQIQIDTQNLYQETAFTDLKVGSFRRLSPVHADGSPDPARATFFLVQTHLMTAAGPVPLDFRIDAPTLEEMAAKFPQAAQKAFEEMLTELEALRREQASSLIIPGGGNGKIQFP